MRLQGHAHAFGGILRAAGGRDDPVDQGQASDPFGQRTGQQHRNDRPKRMPEQGKMRPPHLLGDAQHIVGVIGQGIAGASRAMVGMAMARQVQGQDAQALEPGRQAGKAVGVVEPAVQGNYRQAIGGPEQVRGQLDMTQVQANFFHFATHAGVSCQRSNRSLIRLAVSVGCSSGNIWPPGRLWYSPFGMPRTARA
ncbi:hypothetical protein D3C79_634240 [compost metagenome]